VVEETYYGLVAFLACFGLAMGIGGCIEALPSRAHYRNAVGMFIGVAMMVAGILVMGTREEFVFDRGKRAVSWTREKIIRSERGSVNFDEISDVRVNWDTMPQKAPMYRVELVTSHGIIPVRSNFACDKKECEEVVAAIKSVLWT
jgi:hypothetical protein